jgi:hypothetical protein
MNFQTRLCNTRDKYCRMPCTMDFFTRCCKKTSLAPQRTAQAFIRLLLLAAATLALVGAQATRATGIEVRNAAVTAADDGYVLDAQFEVQLTPVLDDALHKGVPLYFVLEHELIRSRWYWTNEKVALVQQQRRLSYNTLTRQYRVGSGALYQNFMSLHEALETLSRVRRRLDLDPGALRRDTTYAAALRMRLDTTQLPRPFQLHTGRNWDIASDWYRWTVTP